MRKALRTSILILALSGSAYAGDIPNDSPTPPTATAGNIPCDTPAPPDGDKPADAQATEITVADIALSVLQSALSVL